MSEDDAASSPPAPIPTGLLGRCPRCGQRSMFAGFLTLAPRCPACGLDLGFADPGDGPSFFASFLGGFVTLLAGVVVQIAYEPAWWVYLPLLLGGTLLTIGLIRPLKGLLVALQYTNKAEQGHFEP